MLQNLISLDKNILTVINGCNTPFWDDFFYIFSGQKVWILVILAIIFTIIKNENKSAIWVFVGIAILITLSDQISSGLIKPWVERLRPSRDPSLEGIVHIVNNYRSGGYSFVSSHAANAFAFATFSALLMKRKIYGYTIFSWATITAYSRIYLGVHFPLDVLCGALLGTGIGLLVYSLLCKFKSEYKTKRMITQSDAYIVLISFIITILATSICHSQLMKLLA